jgi:hypothetical protein
VYTDEREVELAGGSEHRPGDARAGLPLLSEAALEAGEADHPVGIRQPRDHRLGVSALAAVSRSRINSMSSGSSVPCDHRCATGRGDILSKRRLQWRC